MCAIVIQCTGPQPIRNGVFFVGMKVPKMSLNQIMCFKDLARNSIDDG